ncbi:ArsR/SmtB family transcription factor [Cellulomonas soli]
MVETTTAEQMTQERIALLQAVADPVRWTVLDLLSVQARCVCNLQEHVDIAGNLLSYHLKVLREAGLVTSSRRGRWVDYALADGARERMSAALPAVPEAPAAPVVPALLAAGAP